MLSQPLGQRAQMIGRVVMIGPFQSVGDRIQLLARRPQQLDGALLPMVGRRRRRLGRLRPCEQVWAHSLPYISMKA